MDYVYSQTLDSGHFILIAGVLTVDKWFTYYQPCNYVQLRRDNFCVMALVPKVTVAHGSIIQ